MKTPISQVECCDNMEFMSRFPDKFFDLAIVDPPYGIKQDGRSNHTRSKLAKSKNYTGKFEYDNMCPEIDYFLELKRVTKNQIVWGANHFIHNMPFGSSCWVVWDKDNGNTDFADCELAYTSFKSSVRKFKYKWQGMLQENMKHKDVRIHPNQKPVALYSWLLQNYAKPGDKILDTHRGSDSLRIAAFKLGFDFWGCEIDQDYHNEACERFDRECHGVIKQENGIKVKQQSINF